MGAGLRTPPFWGGDLSTWGDLWRGCTGDLSRGLIAALASALLFGVSVGLRLFFSILPILEASFEDSKLSKYSN